MSLRKLPLAAVAATLALGALPAAATADNPVAVCNEAENSFRGGYSVNPEVGSPADPVDPNPPAFLRGSLMRVGKGAGLVKAAFHSPALRLCGPAGGGDNGGGGGDEEPPAN